MFELREGALPQAELFSTLRALLPSSEARSLISVLSSPQQEDEAIKQIVFGMNILDAEEQLKLTQTLIAWSSRRGDYAPFDTSRLNQGRDYSGAHELR